MQSINQAIDSGDGVFIGGKHLRYKNNTPKTMTTSFSNESIDQELQIIDLSMVCGGGKEAKTKVGKWIEKTFGDGDGTHTGGDYVDEGIKILGAIIVGKGGSKVHQAPGSDDPGPGVWH